MNSFPYVQVMRSLKGTTHDQKIRHTTVAARIWNKLLQLVNPRVPLERGQTARELLEEQGLWEEYKLKYPYNPMAKFDDRFAVGTQPMTNDANVSNSSKCLSQWMNRTLRNSLFWSWIISVSLVVSSWLTMESFPLERLLSPSRSSLTLAHQICGCPLCTAAVQPAVCKAIPYTSTH